MNKLISILLVVLFFVTVSFGNEMMIQQSIKEAQAEIEFYKRERNIGVGLFIGGIVIMGLGIAATGSEDTPEGGPSAIIAAGFIMASIGEVRVIAANQDRRVRERKLQLLYNMTSEVKPGVDEKVFTKVTAPISNITDKVTDTQAAVPVPETPKPEVKIELNDEQKKILGAIDKNGSTLEDVMKKTNYSKEKLQPILDLLEKADKIDVIEEKDFLGSKTKKYKPKD